MTGGFPGGQAEYVRVPFGEVNLLKVPKELSGMSPDFRYLYRSTLRMKVQVQ